MGSNDNQMVGKVGGHMSSHFGLHSLLGMGRRKWGDSITSKKCRLKWDQVEICHSDSNSISEVEIRVTLRYAKKVLRL